MVLVTIVPKSKMMRALCSNCDYATRENHVIGIFTQPSLEKPTYNIHFLNQNQYGKHCPVNRYRACPLHHPRHRCQALVLERDRHASGLGL